VLGTGAPHGLRHAWFEKHGYQSVTTHVVGPKKKSRFFDHMLVSDHFEIEEGGYHLSWCSRGLSDHAAGWARIRLRSS
jgi:endonuclease/exonuclease/phosphatase family metal-dependent hydrolase